MANGERAGLTVDQLIDILDDHIYNVEGNVDSFREDGVIPSLTKEQSEKIEKLRERVDVLHKKMDILALDAKAASGGFATFYEMTQLAVGVGLLPEKILDSLSELGVDKV